MAAEFIDIALFLPMDPSGMLGLTFGEPSYPSA
jgi:hypothetical protein